MSTVPLNVSYEYAPVFVLDTSLESVTNPIDAHDSHNDMTHQLNGGDLIRAGHPMLGERFKVSANISHPFNASIVPLSSVEDSLSSASLSFSSLSHSTYEVQSIVIKALESSISLSPSHEIASGFRLRFDDETTATTLLGGAAGCLKWDGDAEDIKNELETLINIDSVDVSRESIEYEEAMDSMQFRKKSPLL